MLLCRTGHIILSALLVAIRGRPCKMLNGVVRSLVSGTRPPTAQPHTTSEAFHVGGRKQHTHTRVSARSLSERLRFSLPFGRIEHTKWWR